VKTYAVKASDIERQWWVVDASDQTLGRLATRIATLLEGKHKPTYSPHLDTGDHVVVSNQLYGRSLGLLTGEASRLGTVHLFVHGRVWRNQSENS
jgi:hypothetical protein